MENKSKFPRVTEILGKYVDYSMLPDGCRERGIALHGWISAYLKGNFLIKPKEVKEKCENIQKWIDIMVGEIIINETRFEHEVLGYCGKPDAIIKIKGEKTLMLVDWKSSQAVFPTYFAQLAAYKELLRANNIEAKRAIIVPAISPVKIIEKDLQQPLQAFLAALTAHKYFIKTGEEK